MSLNQAKGWYKVVTFVLSMVILCAFAQIHLRLQTTITGYNIGQLKNEELKELKNQSMLKLNLAKLSSRSHLEFASNSVSPEAEQDVSLTVSH